MKYKNYKWKFANSVLVILGIVFIFLMATFILIAILLKEYSAIPLFLITFAVMLVPSYFVLLLVGDILYHKTKVSIKNEGIYQNKRLLKYDNIRSIHYNKMFSIFSFEIKPFKDGVFVSKRILLYFYSLEEVYHFIITHGLSYFLSYGYQYQAIVSYIKQVINQYGEDLHPNYVELFNDLKTTCDCCGNNSVFKRLTNDICPVCFWESDKDIIYNPNIVSDVNHISLADAKANYYEFGACEAEFKDKVRKPFSYEKK